MSLTKDTMTHLRAPFPYFGGKSRIAPAVWQRFGTVQNYVEPFFGSGAVLLARPDWPERQSVETVNDADGFLCNFWRALQSDPEAVTAYADWPVNECDLHARHLWLKPQREELTARLEADPDYYDAKIAGWWVWGMAQWIGGGFCSESGSGPWQVASLPRTSEESVKRQLPHLGNAGRGVTKKSVYAATEGPERAGTGAAGLSAWMETLASRLERVRVCCGDWSRVMGPSVTHLHGLTAVFFDPPYSKEAGRDMDCYHEDTGQVAHEVRAWCLENGDLPLLRIALCGYTGEHEALEAAGWSVLAWKTPGGMAQGKGKRGTQNRDRERIWFSPHCLGEPFAAQGAFEL